MTRTPPIAGLAGARPRSAPGASHQRRAGRAVSIAALVCALALAAGGCADTNAPPAEPFEEFAWATREPDVRAERLCEEEADPDHAPDTTFIHCSLEGASFAPTPPAPAGEIAVLAYNIERGFEADRQIAAILVGDPIARPDVLLLSEVDRGCRRTDFRNVARDYAQALGFYYVYATEFVELPSERGGAGPYDPPLCEHGNAIVARWPLGNVRQVRHAANRSWYTPPGFPHPDEPRLGGRVALSADMKVGERLVRLVELHLESSTDSTRIRDAQAESVAEEAALVPHATVVGGDLNAYGALGDLTRGTAFDATTQAFLGRGFADAHASVPLERRPTNFDPIPLVIDFVFARGATATHADICPRERCGDLSDHLPIWATIALP